MSKPPLALVVGLGNPGSQYEATRHNLGHLCVDKWCGSWQGQWQLQSKLQSFLCRITDDGNTVYLAKPITYMNESGRAVGAIMRYYRIEPEQLLVIHDELDLPTGTIRLKSKGGHGGHNGLRDIIQAIGSSDFHRLRIGIDKPTKHQEVANYVLSTPTACEKTSLDLALDKALVQAPNIIKGQLSDAMLALHTE